MAPLRSSDRRRTADQIIAEYELKPKTQNDTTPEDKAATTAEISNLRNALLPDNVQSARFTTTHGPDLKQVSGTVYVGTHPGDEQRVLWFKMEDTLYPTVYTLWRNAGILPLLHTPEFVIKKLQGGADLMTPGLQNGPPFPAKAKKGAIVAIASLEHPSVPVTVGRCEIDVSALGSTQGMRGHAVQTMHWAGDEIWSYSTSNKPGQNPPDRLDGWLPDDVNEEEIAGQTASLTLADEDEGGVAVGGDAAGQEVEEDGQEEVVAMTTKEIDDAFRKAFLYGVYHHVTTNHSQPNYGLVYPLSQSFVMANLVQPFLPAYTPDQANQLQIKKTSYKNIRKFIKSFDKEKIIKSKERDGNETTIIDIDFEDKAFKDFKPYRLPKKETLSGSAQGRGTKATTTAEPDSHDPSIGQRLTKQDLYKPKDRLLPLFAAAPQSQTYFTAQEIRPLITAYIETNNLISPTNKRLVTLNPDLANALFDGTERLDKEVLAKGSVPRDALIDRVLSASAPHYTITSSTSPTQPSKPKSGSCPKIKITLETRSGNKTATKISGLETYFITPQPLADELRKTCAGSTSVEQLQGSSPRNPVMEVMVQGPQRDAVIKALERRGVRGQWVEFIDKTKKGKK